MLSDEGKLRGVWEYVEEMGHVDHRTITLNAVKFGSAPATNFFEITSQLREHLQTLPSHASLLTSSCSLLAPTTLSPRPVLDSSIAEHCAIPLPDPILPSKATLVLDAGLSSALTTGDEGGGRLKRPRQQNVQSDEAACFCPCCRQHAINSAARPPSIDIDDISLELPASSIKNHKRCQ